jgi:RNA polymerase sigma-B factor
MVLQAPSNDVSTEPDARHDDVDFAEYARTRDPGLRDRIIESHLGLAAYLARRYSNRGESTDDLVQVASLALVKSVDRFDVDRDVTFSTFATRTIVGELKRHFRDRTWSVRPPRRLQELCLEVTHHVEALTQSMGRSPKVSELATSCSVSESDVIEALEAAQSYRSVSLDEPGPDGSTLGLSMGGDDESFVDAESRAVFAPHLEALPTREQKILRLRFIEGMTQSEIGKIVGLSQMQVSRILSASLSALRVAYQAHPSELDDRVVTSNR